MRVKYETTYIILETYGLNYGDWKNGETIFQLEFDINSNTGKNEQYFSILHSMLKQCFHVYINRSNSKALRYAK